MFDVYDDFTIDECNVKFANARLTFGVFPSILLKAIFIQKFIFSLAK